jgi:polyvinyl alcohol dehydrogenase (cytochrome)
MTTAIHVLVVSVLLLPARAFAQAPPRDPSRCAPQMMAARLGDPTAGPRWNGWGAGITNTRFQPADQAGLPADQVPKLTLKWAFGFPDTNTAYTQPTVVSGRVFVGSQNGTMYSLDAKTGCTYWTFKAQSSVRSAATVGQRRTAGGDVAYTVYFGDLAGHVYAVDAQTGDLLWARRVDEHRGARVTGAPTLYQDRLYVPVASLEEALAVNPAYPCCSFRGSLVAIDVNTAAVTWKTFTLPENAKPLGRTTTAGQQRWGPSGAGIWSAPTLDAVRRVVYVSTGNMYTEPQQPTSDAVIAVDLDSGRIKWVSQLLPKDVFVVGCGAAPAPNCPPASELGPDFDLGDSPMLARMPSGPGSKDVIVVGQKSGQGWALDPDKKGAVVWQYRAGQGSALGGIEWGPAVDNQNAYFANSDVLREQPGGLHAVRLTTGERAWYTPAPPPVCKGPAPGCSGAQSAAVSVIPGIVFSGSVDGALRAFATGDGKVVWEFDANREFTTVNGVKANGASFGGAGPVIVGGMLFTNSGYGALAGRAGNVLLAFGVD